jgi:hypothetical protein
VYDLSKTIVTLKSCDKDEAKESKYLSPPPIVNGNGEV